jgi:hypothetical protein
MEARWAFESLGGKTILAHELERSSTLIAKPKLVRSGDLHLATAVKVFR